MNCGRVEKLKKLSHVDFFRSLAFKRSFFLILATALFALWILLRVDDISLLLVSGLNPAPWPPGPEIGQQWFDEFLVAFPDDTSIVKVGFYAFRISCATNCCRNVHKLRLFPWMILSLRNFMGCHQHPSAVHIPGAREAAWVKWHCLDLSAVFVSPLWDATDPPRPGLTGGAAGDLEKYGLVDTLRSGCLSVEGAMAAMALDCILIAFSTILQLHGPFM